MGERHHQIYLPHGRAGTGGSAFAHQASPACSPAPVTGCFLPTLAGRTTFVTFPGRVEGGAWACREREAVRGGAVRGGGRRGGARQPESDGEAASW